MRATSGSMSAVALLTPHGACVRCSRVAFRRVMHECIQCSRAAHRVVDAAWRMINHASCVNVYNAVALFTHTSRCRRRAAHDQSCVWCSRSTCHILTSRSTGALVALIALLVSRPTCLLSHCCTTFQSTDHQCLGRWAELYCVSISENMLTPLPRQHFSTNHKSGH